MLALGQVVDAVLISGSEILGTRGVNPIVAHASKCIPSNGRVRHGVRMKNNCILHDAEVIDRTTSSDGVPLDLGSIDLDIGINTGRDHIDNREATVLAPSRDIRPGKGDQVISLNRLLDAQEIDTSKIVELVSLNYPDLGRFTGCNKP